MIGQYAYISKTHRYQQAAKSPKCSFSNVRIAQNAFFALKTIFHKNACITANNSKKNQESQTRPASFFNSERCRKNTNPGQYIDSYFPTKNDKSAQYINKIFKIKLASQISIYNNVLTKGIAQKLA